MSKHTWIANAFPPDDEEDIAWEVAIVRSDNKHGFKSFGWEDESKIIVASGDSYAPYPDNEIKNCDHALKRAKVMADALNKEKL